MKVLDEKSVHNFGLLRLPSHYVGLFNLVKFKGLVRLANYFLSNITWETETPMNWKNPF